MKIHIVGCSGSGKTYLAKHFSKKYNIPHFDLDEMQWDNQAETYGTRNSPEKRAALLQQALAHEGWVIEGVYYAWVQKSFAEADQIYVLDVPKYVYRYRILKRSLKRKLGLEKGKKETLKSVCDLLKWTETYQKTNLEEISRILEPYGNKVMWLSKRRDIRALLQK